MKNKVLPFFLLVLGATGLVSSCTAKKSDENNTAANIEAGSTEKPDSATFSGPMPVIRFEEMEHDFGEIKEGAKVSYEYKFTNAGEAPLVVQSARPSCGCTVSAWTKDPVPVGGKGFVRVEFDSRGKLNVQNKTVTVTANTSPETTVLHFKAAVIPAARKP